MRFSLLFFIILFLTNKTFGQTAKVQAYIEKYKDIAIAEMKRSGVPAAITLAQGIFESANGESNLCINSNNHFGIKCKTEWTGEKVYHNDDAKGECFRKYNTAEESFIDHSNFLTSRSHYAFLFSLNPEDYKAWAYGLKKAGYATNPTYPQRLIKLIEDNNLHLFTALALNKPLLTDAQTINTNAPEAAISPIATIATPAPPQSLSNKKDTVNIPLKQDTIALNTIVIDTLPKQATVVNTYPEGVFTINGLQVTYAQEGASLLALATEHDLALSDLFLFNELEIVEILPKAQLVFLQKKLKKGAKDYHIVTENESMYDIAQCEGILLSSLLEYNRIPKNRNAAIGEKIYLKTNSPTTPRLL